MGFPQIKTIQKKSLKLMKKNPKKVKNDTNPKKNKKNQENDTNPKTCLCDL